MKKSKRFVNQYEYNSDFVKEAISAWWNIKFKKSIIVMILLIISMVILFLITQKLKWLVLGIFCLLPIVLLYFKKKIAIKTEIERMSVVYKGKPLIIKVVFDKDVRVITSQGERSVELSSIYSFTETKNLIVLMIKGSMTIAISKDGFIEGNSEEFLKHIKTNISKQN